MTEMNKGDRKQTVMLSLAVFYFFALPLIFLNLNVGRAFSDQNLFHLPTILHFIQDLNLTDYSSATTPGYHLLLAFFGKVISSNEMFLKFTNSLLTAALIGLSSSILYNIFGRTKTLILLLPMIFSVYVFPAGVWLVPDNLAWLIVLAMLIIVTKYPPTNKIYLFLGLLLFLAMLVRQPYLWLASTIFSYTLSYFFCNNAKFEEKIYFIWLSFIVILPAFVLFYGFYVIWGGLTPPSFQARHEYLSLSAPAYFFATYFIYNLFFISVYFDSIKFNFVRNNYIWLTFGFLMGLTVSIFPDTNFSVENGRYSGVWSFAKVAPVFFNKSVLIIVLSSLGGSLFVLSMLLVSKKLRLIILFSTLGFIISLIPNAFVYERYFAGYHFILIYIFLTNLKFKISNIGSIAKFAGPVLFSILNLYFLSRSMI